MAKKKRNTKYWKSQLALDRLILRLPSIISGTINRRGTPERRLYNAFWSHVIQTVFVELHHAYEQKSNFSYDDNGQIWYPLEEQYRAYKRRDQRSKLLTRNQRRKLAADTPGLLSPSQYRRWRKTFIKVYKKEIRKASGRGKTAPKEFLSPGRYKKYLKTAERNKPIEMTDKEAKAKAAAIAWAEAKAKGAETLIGTLGEKFMPIMRITGTLMDSLSPGKISNLKYIKGNKNQVVRMGKGSVFIGSKVPYAKFAARAIPANPQKKRPRIKREFLPPPGEMGVFLERALKAGNDAVMVELQRLVDENEHLS